MITRSAWVAIGMAACAFGAFPERDAAACGGCFHPPPPPNQSISDITDERMLLSVTQNQTTLFDQIRYSGTPSQFAWVLPIKGTVDVGLSADVMFDSIDALTTTKIIAPPQNCPPPPNCGSTTGAAFANGAAEGDNGGGSVTVTKQENVGPFETVQLHTTDPQALSTWLAQNGFEIPSDVSPVIDEYVTEGFDFLAMKLLPNEGVQAMRPVRVTMPGASLSLPLRMAAIGTGASVGITIWVVSDGRYEPQNFPFFHIEDKDLVWDWSKSQSNYTTLRSQNQVLLNGRGWEVESSIDVNEQLISNTIVSGGQSTSANTQYGNASNAADDYLPVGDPDGGEDAGPTQTADEARAADIAALFGGLSGNLRITRMRSDISHAAMTSDFLLQASADQSQLSNVRQVTNGVNTPACPDYPGCGILGCDASSGPIAGVSGLFATAFGLLGVVLTRVIRRRKRRETPPKIDS